MINIKTSNGLEPLDLSKIQSKLKKYSENLDTDYLNIDLVATKVAANITDGITSQEIDEYTAQVCEQLSVEHPDYLILGGRILADRLQKEAPSKFSESVKALREFNEHLVSDDYYNTVMQHADYFDSLVKPERDFDVTIFEIESIKKKYLLATDQGLVETPQYYRMRVAVSLWGNDLDRVKQTYERLSQKQYTQAGCTSSQAGKQDGQLANCILMSVEDNLIDEHGIYDSLKQVANYQKGLAGLGVALTKLRAKGSDVAGEIGVCKGVLPVLKLLEQSVKYVFRGKKAGSIAVYLETWHADIMEYLKAKRPNTPIERGAPRLDYGLVVNDLFMQRVAEDGDWSVFCPKDAPELVEAYGEDFAKKYAAYEAAGKARKVYRARDIMNEILMVMQEAGQPYMLNKDEVNYKNNLKHVAPIIQSNLCVAPETLLLTKDGWGTISELDGQDVEVWNGEEWSLSKVAKTGENQALIQVKLTDGTTLDCTPYHKFYKITSYKNQTPVEVEAENLKKGDKLIKWSAPVIEQGEKMRYAYTHGLFCADGTYDAHHHPKLYLYNDKQVLLPYIDVKTTTAIPDSSNRINIMLPRDLASKFYVPLKGDLESKLEWLAGYLDGDGTVVKNKGNQSIQVTSVDRDFLLNVKMLLQTVGVQSKLRPSLPAQDRLLPDGKGGKQLFACQATYRLLITSNGVQQLLNLGYNPRRLQVTLNYVQRKADKFVQVESVNDFGRVDDTYCVNEPDRHMIAVNGMLTGNCIEITLPTNNGVLSTCNLGNIILPSCVENGKFNFEKLRQLSYEMCENLNQVIDKTYYPEQRGKDANLANRPIGIGIQGLADTFAMLDLAYESESARELNKQISETIYFGAMQASNDLAKERGVYPNYQGSPASQGQLQFDFWQDRELTFNKHAKTWEISKVSPVQLSGLWDWDSLKANIKKHGLHNSLLTAYMPTLGSSQVIGNTQSFEPFQPLVTKQKTLAGEFLLVNRHFVRDMIKAGLWTADLAKMVLDNDGSVQNIEGIPDNIKAKYKNYWEVSMKHMLVMAAERSPFIDHSSSQNWYVKKPSTKGLDEQQAEQVLQKYKVKLLTLVKIAHLLGLKTLVYYLETGFEQKTAVGNLKITKKKDAEPEPFNDGSGKRQFACEGGCE